ncbi:hypothetical protein OROMI_008169 [Orobanche minor]
MKVRRIKLPSIGSELRTRVRFTQTRFKHWRKKVKYPGPIEFTGDSLSAAEGVSERRRLKLARRNTFQVQNGISYTTLKVSFAGRVYEKNAECCSSFLIIALLAEEGEWRTEFPSFYFCEIMR